MIKNGDLPAMPTQVNGGDIFGGLTKREAFAMAAMQGIVSSLTEDDCLGVEDIASWSVKYADALLAKLERTNGL